MQTYLKLNLLKQLDKDGVLDVSHYENILLKAFEKAGFNEENKPDSPEDFTSFYSSIESEIERAEFHLEDSRKKANGVVEEGEYSPKEKEELKSMLRKKFLELFNFYDSQKEMALTTFDDEFKVFVRFNYFKADKTNDLPQETKDKLFEFVYSTADYKSDSFESLCEKVKEYNEYLQGVLEILYPSEEVEEIQEEN